MPGFQSSSSSFYVILPNLNYGADSVSHIEPADIVDTMPTDGADLPPLTKNQKIAVRAIRTNPGITIAMLQVKTKLAFSSVARLLSDLKKREIIRRVGPDKGGHWEIIQKPEVWREASGRV